MFRFEFKKNVIANKFWVLIILIFFSTVSTHLYTKSTEVIPEHDTYEYYYEVLKGEISKDKINYLSEEKNRINNYESDRQEITRKYKSEEISDEEYQSHVETLNLTRKRSKGFEDISEYVMFLEHDESLRYVNEAYLNSILKMRVPYTLITFSLLTVIISFQNEKKMQPITLTTLHGKQKLFRTKIVVLLIINSMIFFVYKFSVIFLRYDSKYVSDYYSKLKSLPSFQGSFFDGKIIEAIVITAVMQWLAIVLLTLFTSKFCLKSKLNGYQILMINMGMFLIFGFLLSESRYMYYLSPFGFFNPLRYFWGKVDGYEGIQYIFNSKDIIFVSVMTISLTMICLTNLKKNLSKISILCCILLLLVGCEREEKIENTMMYGNTNGISCNESVCLDVIDNKMLEIGSDVAYELNRNPFQVEDVFTNHFIYKNYVYYIASNEKNLTIQRVDTTTFNQVEIYRKNLVRYDIFGNITGFERFYLPIQLFVNEDNVYLTYHDRIEQIISKNKSKILLDSDAEIFASTSSNLFYLSTDNLLKSLNLSTLKSHTIVETLVQSPVKVEDTFYYIKLKNDFLYSYDIEERKERLIVDEAVFQYQIDGTHIYYVNQEMDELKVKSIEGSNSVIILMDVEINGFMVLEDRIMISSEDGKNREILKTQLPS